MAQRQHTGAAPGRTGLWCADVDARRARGALTAPPMGRRGQPRPAEGRPWAGSGFGRPGLPRAGGPGARGERAGGQALVRTSRRGRLRLPAS
ncbi:unnamed protein product [Prorocentrum cordatum]|uniref:Uncharacterized protein n=1 Tax=Prorocentrum cordatum TaxID=2364126 RepID=A0ABN9U4S6_9DINO|nr:unnamed protein product [Polarella glacialis]